MWTAPPPRRRQRRRTPAETPAGVVLADLRQARADREAAELRSYQHSLAWAALHEVDDVDRACVFDDSPVPVAGEGAPLIGEEAVSEYAAALGVATDTGKRMLGQVVEIGHRLPKLHARVTAGKVLVWQARRIAEHTITLNPDAASWVDAQVAGFANKIRLSQLDRTITAAIDRFMPAEAEAEAMRQVDTRKVVIRHQQVSAWGMSDFHGTLDLADALDLDAALTARANELKALGSTDTRDVRRSLALGELARRQLALGFHTEADAESKTVTPPVRGVDLTVHISELALAGCTCGAAALARTEHGSPLVTTRQVQNWCAQPGTLVRVRPVIDLDQHASGTRYETPALLREHLALRDDGCVFPWCTKKASVCDCDHITPHDADGPTCDCNLALLCRTHHRLKTHTRWRYDHHGHGVHVWRSPHGLLYRRDPSGTQAINPNPAARPPTTQDTS